MGDEFATLCQIKGYPVSAGQVYSRSDLHGQFKVHETRFADLLVGDGAGAAEV